MSVVGVALHRASIRAEFEANIKHDYDVGGDCSAYDCASSASSVFEKDVHASDNVVADDVEFNLFIAMMVMMMTV